jgi:hypothetical protein
VRNVRCLRSRTLRVVLGLASFACLMLPSTRALANPPNLIYVTQQDRHPIVRFSAPRADDVSVSIATSPRQATDGSFLNENVVGGDFLTGGEVELGRWEDDNQLDPGHYWVLINASADTSCENFETGVTNPNCADGTSFVMPLTIPEPRVIYKGSVPSVWKYLGAIDVRLTAKPLGVNQPYKVCYQSVATVTSNPVWKCLRGTLDGYDWDSSTDDDLTINVHALLHRTKFIWYVDGRQVTSHVLTYNG